MNPKPFRIIFSFLLLLSTFTMKAQSLPCQNPNSQRNQATTLSSVTNPTYAIDNSASTYATLYSLSGGAIEWLKFPSGAIAGDTIKIKLSFAVPITYTDMVSNVTIGSYVGTTSNNDLRPLSDPSVNLTWSSSTEVIASFAPSVNFDWVVVWLTALESYQVNEVRIHYAYKPTPPPTVTPANSTICPGQKITLSAAGQSGSIYKWFTQPTGGVGIFTGTSYTTPNLTNTITYYVTAELHGCQSVRTPATVTVSSLACSEEEQSARFGFTTGISSNEESVKFYPNPFYSELTIELEPSITGNVKIEVSNLTGEQVAVYNARTSQLTLPTDLLEPGTYVCKIYTEDKIYVRKIIKYHY